MVERQFDAQIKVQDHQAKMQQTAAKTQAMQEQAFIKNATEQQKMQNERIKTRQSAQQRSFENAQKLRQADEQHRMRMAQSVQAQQLKTRPGRGGGKGGTGL